MDDDMIKTALAYDLASDFHEIWRITRRREDGTYEPRIKTSTDVIWNKLHGTDEVDIANCSFRELPLNWKVENLEAAKFAINETYDRLMQGGVMTFSEIEQISSNVHEAWLGRNIWVYDKDKGDPKLALPYDELTVEEKEKDRRQVMLAIEKVKQYLEGLIDLDVIVDKYNITPNKKTPIRCLHQILT